MADPFEFRVLRADDGHFGRNHDCIKIDWERGYACHRDCSDCGCVVFVEQSGPESQDFDVPLDEGAICFDCKEVSCTDCITRNTVDGRPRCLPCEERSRLQLQEEDEMFAAIDRTAADLKAYLACLRKETDPAKIRESITRLHKVEDLFADINRDLMPNIERAAGKQIRLLPGRDAA